MTQDELKKAVARAAVEYVPMGGVIGVGTGSTANFFIEELGRVKHKFDGAVASSDATAQRLTALGIQVLDTAATIFSRVSAPPPPLIIANEGVISSAPST